MKIRLTQIDGRLPNLALMKLAHYHKSRGDEVRFYRHVNRELDEPNYDLVYGSQVFTFSQRIADCFLREWNGAILRGTGTGNLQTVEQLLGISEYEFYDYSIYPDYEPSIGFTARGCRLSCGFCIVPKKEGRPKPTNSIYDIWRGEGHPKNVCLLDNDFFGQPSEQWRARVDELVSGKFKVCFNQGINVRLIDDESSAALATLRYYDDQFKVRRLYTAWDNLKDEKIFFNGVDRLERAGIRPQHLMVYMLIGYDREETWERIFYRFDKMVARGVLPYPMVYNNADRNLKRFQRYVIMRFYKTGITFDQFTNENRRVFNSMARATQPAEQLRLNIVQ